MRATVLSGYLTIVTLMMLHIAQTSDDSHWHILVVLGTLTTAAWVWLGLRMVREDSKKPPTKTDPDKERDGQDA